MRISVSVIVLPGTWLLLSAQSNLSWTTYNGQISGNRYSSLTGITTTNVSGLKVVRTFPISSPSGLETTPVVSGTTMYITSTNSVYAYGLSTGQLTWSFVRPQTPGVAQDAGAGMNRGIALGTSSVFLATDNAHLLALDISTGALQWETTIADSTQNYGATSAPLYLSGPDLVVTGVSGGDSGIRGFLAAYSATTGNQVWNFWTTPLDANDPLAASWGSGGVLPHGGGATWLTGTYDATTNIVYWGVGNPCRDFNGDDRAGDNLYTSSVIALNATTGVLQWYFQFTPHGLWDYDGVNTPMLIDATWQGAPRHLLFQANRNGYFYTLDRGTGQFLSGFPFVSSLNWTTGLDANGRPAINPAAVPIKTGVQVCPGVAGATNWMSSAFSPVTGLFYVQVLEQCNLYYKGALSSWQAGKAFEGGYTQPVQGQPGTKHLRALNPFTQTIVWDYPQSGATGNGGVLATAGGLVFTGETGGSFSAFDASTGIRLWTHAAGSAQWKASPMTYQFNGKQFVAIANPGRVMVFGL